MEIASKHYLELRLSTQNVPVTFLSLRKHLGDYWGPWASALVHIPSPTTSTQDPGLKKNFIWNIQENFYLKNSRKFLFEKFKKILKNLTNLNFFGRILPEKRYSMVFMSPSDSPYSETANQPT